MKTPSNCVTATIMKKNILLLLVLVLVLAANSCSAWPVVVFNPTNGVVLIPTNFVAANLAGVSVTNTFNGTATNLSGNALVQVTNTALALRLTTATNISGGALTQVTNIAQSLSGSGTSGFTGTVTNVAMVPGVVTNSNSLIPDGASYSFLDYSQPTSYVVTGISDGVAYNFTAGNSVSFDALISGSPVHISPGSFSGVAGGIYYLTGETAPPTGPYVPPVITAAITSSSFVTNTLHFNLTTFTNGSCVTNVFQ